MARKKTRDDTGFWQAGGRYYCRACNFSTQLINKIERHVDKKHGGMEEINEPLPPSTKEEKAPAEPVEPAAIEPDDVDDVFIDPEIGGK